MNNQEYIKGLFAKYNADPNDPSLTENEKMLLGKIQETGKKLASFEQQLEGVQKEINQKSQQMVELRGMAVKEQGRQEAFLDAIVSMRK